MTINVEDMGRAGVGLVAKSYEERIAELEELLDSSYQTIHALKVNLVKLEAEKKRMLRLVGDLRDLSCRKVVTGSVLREFCDMFIAEFGETEGGE